MLQNQIEILEANYWEHFKFAKDLSLFLPVNNEKRKRLEAEMHKMITELNLLKSQNKK